MKYNTEILKALSKKYGYSTDYIRKCLRKDRNGIMPDKIRKDYKTIESDLEKSIKETITK